MGYFAVLFPLVLLVVIGWLFLTQIIPQLQQALGA